MSGDPILRITIAYTTWNDEGEVYSQDTLEWPLLSKEALLFGRVGVCVQVGRSLEPCH